MRKKRVLFRSSKLANFHHGETPSNSCEAFASLSTNYNALMSFRICDHTSPHLFHENRPNYSFDLLIRKTNRTEQTSLPV